MTATPHFYDLRERDGRKRIFGPTDVEPDPWWTWREEIPTTFSYVGSTSAESWIAAKAAFGFPLTPLQTRMLSGQATYFDIFGTHMRAEPVRKAKHDRKTPTREVHPKYRVSVEDILAGIIGIESEEEVLRGSATHPCERPDEGGDDQPLGGPHECLGDDGGGSDGEGDGGAEGPGEAELRRG